MKKEVRKEEAKKKIDEFFEREDFTALEVKKIKRLANSHSIKLGRYRRRFCKNCDSYLKGELRINGNYKTIKCSSCGSLNRHKLVWGKEA